MEITELLNTIVKQNASDLHLSAGYPPMIRQDGEIQILDLPALDEETTTSMLYSIMNEQQRKDFTQQWEIDFSFTLETLARFRVNAFKQVHGTSCVLRVIPKATLTIEQLGLPPIYETIALLNRGLVLVTGPTGSGKSTTLAALIDHINQNRRYHIITIEDPIEFVHQSKRCLISQREVHKHTHSFQAALRSALREDPDIILVGEMRDLETIRLALTAAETGHLVFGTLHTTSAAKTINRIIDVFPGEEKQLIRSMLSGSLEAVLAQTLVKKIDQGRVVAVEIMRCTPAIRNLIREDKIAQIYSVLQTGQAHGMQTLDQHLKILQSKSLISESTAREFSIS